VSTMEQQELLPFGEPRADPPTIRERFERFLEEQPDVWELFVDAARRLKARGYRRYGAKSIVEHIRFHKAVSGTDADGWKINNVLVSRMARKLMEEHPDEFDGFFETRELKSE
jgi:hypothetical protein